MQIAGTTAIVTGGASGLGAAAARALAAAGAHVVALDLRDQVEAAGTGSMALPENVEVMAADITAPDQVQAAVDHAASLQGPLRIVVNCAGIGPSMRVLGKRGPHDLAFFAKVVQVNLLGTVNVMTLAAEKIAATEPLDDGARGVVINTASIAAFDGQVGQAAYASSKGGVVALTLPAARDLAQHGIRVNTICPGIVDTPMLATVSEQFRAGLAAGVPFPQRFARPDEFASLVQTIAEHDYLNGETIRMDGALRMAPR